VRAGSVRLGADPVHIDPGIPQALAQLAGVLLQVAQVVELQLELAERQPGEAG